jgi:sporulation protein YlmC with PRC-barrel domain
MHSAEGKHSQAESLRIGSNVLARDGECGELVRVVINPVAQALTHLVVVPEHEHGLGRLVPVQLVESVAGDQITLQCTVAQFHALDDASDVEFSSVDTDRAEAAQGMWIAPYYALAKPQGGTYRKAHLVDRVPLGDVEVRHGDAVHASDGWIGSVQGLVIDPTDQHVTHVLLQEGHFWGRKQVAIPIGAASRVGEEIQVGMTRQEVEDLPPVELDRT